MSDGITIGPLTLHYYGLLIMLGVIAAAVLSHFEAKRRGEDTEVVWDSLTWVIIGGVIGARLWHIFTPPASMVAQGYTTLYYLTHPLKAIAIWEGGLGIPGAVAGGALAFYLYARKRDISFGMWADIIAPGLALAQAIGRWGNFINQEVYGRPSQLPWAITIDKENRLPEYMGYVTYHPLFLYESVFNLVNMFFLLWISRKFSDKLKKGDVFLTYLISYPIFRFFMEYLRLDRSLIGGINANQTMMLLIAVLSAGFIIWRHRETLFKKGRTLPSAESTMTDEQTEEDDEE